MLSIVFVSKFAFGEDIGSRPMLLIGGFAALSSLQMICFGVMAEMMSRIYHESSDNATYAIRHSFTSESQRCRCRAADVVVGSRLLVLDDEPTACGRRCRKPATSTKSRLTLMIDWLSATRWRMPVILIVYFSLHVAARSLVSPSLDYDESEQVFLSQCLSYGYNSQPPLYTWVQTGLFEILGYSVFSLAVLKNLLLCGTYLLVFGCWSGRRPTM